MDPDADLFADALHGIMAGVPILWAALEFVDREAKPQTQTERYVRVTSGLLMFIAVASALFALLVRAGDEAPLRRPAIEAAYLLSIIAALFFMFVVGGRIVAHTKHAYETAAPEMRAAEEAAEEEIKRRWVDGRTHWEGAKVAAGMALVFYTGFAADWVLSPGPSLAWLGSAIAVSLLAAGLARSAKRRGRRSKHATTAEPTGFVAGSAGDQVER